MIGEVRSLLAICHPRDQGRIVRTAGLDELIPGFPSDSPVDHRAEASVRQFLQTDDVPRPLREPVFAWVLVEIITSLCREGRLTGLAPSGGWRERA